MCIHSQVVAAFRYRESVRTNERQSQRDRAEIMDATILRPWIDAARVVGNENNEATASSCLRQNFPCFPAIRCHFVPNTVPPPPWIQTIYSIPLRYQSVRRQKNNASSEESVGH